MSLGDGNSSEEIVALASRMENRGQSRMTTKPKRKRMPRWFIVLYYIFLSVVAIALTILSEGTKLWHGGEIDEMELLSLLGHYLAVLIAFYCVHNSDPGYITNDVMQRVCEEDGLPIDGNGSQVDGDPPSSFSSPTAEVEMTSLNQSMESNVNASSMNRRNKPNDDDNNSATLEEDFNTPWKQTRRKVCTHCNIAPPLRSHHCKICDKCVATFDHHCGFIGTCIGERNHCRFYWFLVIQFLGFLKCCSILRTSPLSATCWLNLACRRTLDPDIMYLDVVVVVASRGYVYLLTIMAFTMVGLHTWLMITNGTTFEMEKREHVEYLRGVEICDVPFSNGLCGNLRMFCCTRDATANICHEASDEQGWKPIMWKPVGHIVRDSEDWMNHPWQNKYWTCC